MKKVLVILGVILLVVGLLMMLFLWPMIGVESPGQVMDKIEEGDYEEGDSIRMVGEVEETGEILGMKYMYIKDFEMDIMGTTMPVPIENTVDASEGDTVLIEGTVGEDEFTVSKVPTVPGILGLIIMIVGIILMIVGFVTGKAAAPAPQQPPMQQQPYQQPPPQQPYQPPPQQPYQPPPQQPYQPPPQPPPR